MSGRDSPVIFAPNSDSEEWLREWQSVRSRDLIDSPVVTIDRDATVEEACEVLLSKNAECIAITSPSSTSESPFLGLFDYADVNAFLTLAATQRTIHPDELHGNPRLEQIIQAAKAGQVPVHLVSNLSEKNPLESLSEGSTIVELLGVFAQGTHRVLIRSGSSRPVEYLGMVTDRALMRYFHSHAKSSPALARYLSNPLHSLSLPSLNLRSDVVSCSSAETVLDAMKAMSEQGVSSVAVIEDTPGSSSVSLLSAVTVTDIGKIVVPSQSKSILATQLHQFVSRIKGPVGSTDGAEAYPVYSVSAASSLRYTMEKILATTSHRVFVTEDSSLPSSPISSSPPTSTSGTLLLRGVVSVVDILSLFARLANLPDVDPTRMQRQRRASSASTSSRSNR